MSISKTKVTPVIGKENNFDLVRLIAASQVAFTHGGTALGVKLAAVFGFVSYLPAVPAFFGISGFLIANAYCRNPDIRKYARNRFLRLYPGLWACLALTILLLFFFGILNGAIATSFSFIKWLICQATFCQFYTPDYLRSWGVGTPNGSLWTICVELQFYIFLPLYIFLYRRLSRNWFIVISLILFFGSWGSGLLLKHIGESELTGKLLHVTLAPFLHYFLLGIWSFMLWDKIRRFFEGKFLWWLLAYAGYIILFKIVLHSYEQSYYPTPLGWLSNTLQWCMVLALAFSWPSLSHKILKGNDISYGVYIYHMIIVNSILSLSLPGLAPGIQLLLMLLCTAVVSLLSWHFVEKPSLKKKKNAGV